MGIVVLGLSKHIHMEDKQDVLAGVIRRELAAASGMAVTALDVPPAGDGLYEELSRALEESDVLLTIGGLDQPGGVKDILVQGLELETQTTSATLAAARAWCAAHPGSELPPEELAEVPAIADVFPVDSGLCGFGMRSREQAVLCLDDDPDTLLPLLLQEVYGYIAQFFHRELHTMAILAEGFAPRLLYNLLDSQQLPEALEYNVASYGGEQFLRLMAPDRPLLFHATETVEALLQGGEDFASPENPLLPPEHRRESRPRPREGKNRRLLVGVIAALLVMAGSMGLLLSARQGGEEKPVQGSESLSEPSSQQESSTGESESEPEEEESSAYANGMPGDYLPRFEELYDQNTDVVGYLEIDETDFAYPVVQYSDNEYYLRRGFDQEENQNGTPFVDYRTNLKTTQNTIVYGHNMRTGTMFETLLQYRDLNFYREHPILRFDSVYEEGEYKVFGMFIANTREEDGEIFDYLNFLDGTEAKFMEYVENVRVRSLLNTGVDVQPGDRLITLSTCSYEFTDARFVVVARKIREDEDPEVDTTQAVKNPTPLMPEIWYTLYGGVNPNKPAGSESSSSQSESSGSTPPESSSAPEQSSSSSAQPPKESSSSRPEPPPSSSEDEEEEDPDEEEPSREPDGDVADEELAVMYNGRLTRMNAYDLVSEIVENETRGALHQEAIKAQVVATYTYIKYSNSVGLYPTVGMRSSVSKPVKNAVDEVLGEACYYKGDYINAVYHSMSCGTTASAKSVWGTNLPYLQPVDSEFDSNATNFETTFKISEEDFADAVWNTYRIDLEESGLEPEDWIVIDYDEMASGDYVGRVEIGGEDTSNGGTVGRGKAITGRSIREQLLGFKLRSTCFDVEYRNGNFVFTVRGFGHGVGMSQWGANYLAENGYTYREILEHYYTGIEVE